MAVGPPRPTAGSTATYERHRGIREPVAVIHNHKRGPNGRGWYDVVSGPVAAFWDQRVAMQDSDQFSFHTRAAVAVLRDSIVLAGEGDPPAGENGPPYSWFPVT